MITIGIKDVVVNKNIEIDEEYFNFGVIQDKICEVGLGGSEDFRLLFL